EFALPVVQAEARDFNLPTDHPMHLGFEAGPWVAKADVIVVLDSVVPWIPKSGGPRRGAKIIHMSSAPLATRYPFRAMEADLLIAGGRFAGLHLLREWLAGLRKSKNGAADGRRKAVASAREDMQARRRKLIDQVKDQSPVHLAWLAHCLDEA